ncbi:MAG: HEPN domain-containing protein [Gemmatimonadota bacterium]
MGARGAGRAHAQQAVEKALKAVLTACGDHFGRTHDLMPLLDQAVGRAPELAPHRAACAQLSAYAVMARYPEEMVEPPREEAREALAWATAIHAIAARFLAAMRPEEVEEPEKGDQEE